MQPPVLKRGDFAAGTFDSRPDRLRPIKEEQPDQLLATPTEAWRFRCRDMSIST